MGGRDTPRRAVAASRRTTPHSLHPKPTTTSQTPLEESSGLREVLSEANLHEVRNAIPHPPKTERQEAFSPKGLPAIPHKVEEAWQDLYYGLFLARIEWPYFEMVRGNTDVRQPP